MKFFFFPLPFLPSSNTTELSSHEVLGFGGCRDAVSQRGQGQHRVGGCCSGPPHCLGAGSGEALGGEVSLVAMRESGCFCAGIETPLNLI